MSYDTWARVFRYEPAAVVSTWRKAVAAVIGSVIYRFIIAIALRANVPSECLKLISACIVALAIAAPTIKANYEFKRRRASAMKGGKGHA